jgi:hypothetical protein
MKLREGTLIIPLMTAGASTAWLASWKRPFWCSVKMLTMPNSQFHSPEGSYATIVPSLARY